MSSINLLGWCTNLPQALYQKFGSKSGDNDQVKCASPYLRALQELEGYSPDLKKRSFSRMIEDLSNNINLNEETLTIKDFDCESSVMTAIVRASIGKREKIRKLIVEALKSDADCVVKIALSANFFFHGSNTDLNASYFLRQIMPRVSARTRFRLINKIATHLKGYESKAEDFFTTFSKSYGIEICLPFLLSCSENFIREVIEKNDVVLPNEILTSIYKDHPSLVIEHLASVIKRSKAIDKTDKEKSVDERFRLLPRLLKKNPKDFADLVELCSDTYTLKLSNNLSEIFLKNEDLKKSLIEKPVIFLKLIPLEKVNRRLRRSEFERLFENSLVSPNPQEIDMDFTLSVLKNYQFNKLTLLQEKLDKKFNYGDIYQDLSSEQMAKIFRHKPSLLPSNELEYRAKLFLGRNSSNLQDYLWLLPPKESILLAKEKLAKPHDKESKSHLLGSMIESCKIYNSEIDLLKVLDYFVERHCDEPNEVLGLFLRHLNDNFELKSLSKEHWDKLLEIIQRYEARNELFNRKNNGIVESTLTAGITNALLFGKNESFLTSLLDPMIDLKVRSEAVDWNLSRDDLNLDEKYIDVLFRRIPKVFGDDHEIWTIPTTTTTLTVAAIETVANHNRRVVESNAKRSATTNKIEAISIEAYPWVLQKSDRYFTENEPKNRQRIVLRHLRREAPSYYENRIDSLFTRYVGTGDAWALLKRNPKKVADNWLGYFERARDILHNRDYYDHVDEYRADVREAKRFVHATKWYSDLPVKFVDRSILEIEKPGSLTVLGLLLEGEALECNVNNLVSSSQPAESSIVDVGTSQTDPEFKKIALSDLRKSRVFASRLLDAISRTDPPVSLSFAVRYCSIDDRAKDALLSVARRVPIDRLLDCSKSLVRDPEIDDSVKGTILSVVKAVTTSAEFDEMQRSVASIGTGVAEDGLHEDQWPMSTSAVKKLMQSRGDPDYWTKLKSCLDRSTAKDANVLLALSQINLADEAFLSNLIEGLIGKVESLVAEDAELSYRDTILPTIVDGLTVKLAANVDEKLLSTIIDAYFCDFDNAKVSSSVRSFAVSSYLLSAQDDAAFNRRVDKIVEAVKKCAESFDECSRDDDARSRPVNYTIRHFVDKALILLPWESWSYNKSWSVIEKLLTLFDTLLPWQEPTTYISLNLFKIHLKHSSPLNFGKLAGALLPSLMEKCGVGELILSDVAQIVDDLIRTKMYYPNATDQLDVKLDVVTGLTRSNDYGCLVAIYLLDDKEVARYGGKYDKIMDFLSAQRNNASVRYKLYEHVNKIPFRS